MCVAYAYAPAYADASAYAYAYATCACSAYAMHVPRSPGTYMLQRCGLSLFIAIHRSGATDAGPRLRGLCVLLTLDPGCGVHVFACC